MPAQDDIAGNGLVEASGLEAVSAREVDDAEKSSRAGADQPAFLALHSHAGIVRNLLATAGQTVEEGCLTAVRHPDQRQGRTRIGRLPYVQGRSIHKTFPGREIS